MRNAEAANKKALYGRHAISDCLRRMGHGADKRCRCHAANWNWGGKAILGQGGAAKGLTSPDLPVPY